ncbi:MAG: NADPH:quinone oxidoreductase family protein [Gammaproteobacteria bacterium]|nr:NADPH:quinone oxidoreductase family protein [Gammaproteobacteria bacterium]
MVHTTFAAYRCHRFGDYHELSLERLPTPDPGDHEVLLETRACAVAFHEMLMVQGLYQLKPPLPFTPGSECAGIVRAVGRGVTKFTPGDCVIGAVRYGAHAEMLVVPGDGCFHLPSLFDFATGAAFLTAYKTAYVALVPRGQLRAGEVLLVHGASGGVGLAAVELGKALGATVIATASTDEKLAVVRAKGADHVINTTKENFRAQVKVLTNGRGADVIFDPVGGDVFDESMRCIATFGRLLVIGFASGRIPSLSVNYALIKQVSIIGVRAGEYGRQNPPGGAEVNRALFELAHAGQLRPHVHARLPFSELAAAFDALAARQAIGRIVLVHQLSTNPSLEA